MGLQIWCSVRKVELENDEGHAVESVNVRCKRCEHETESFGTGEESVRRCLALLHEECPNGEQNFYQARGES